MGLPPPGPSLRAGDGPGLLWRLGTRPVLAAALWRSGAGVIPALAWHSAILGRVMEQWLRCGGESPDQQWPAGCRAPFPRDKAVRCPVSPFLWLCSAARCSAHSYLAACRSQWQHVGVSTLPSLSAALSSWRSPTLPLMGVETVSWWYCAMRTARSGRSTATSMRRATWTSYSMAWMRVSVARAGV